MHQMTNTEAECIVLARLTDFLDACDLAAEVAGFPDNNARLVEAARLRLAQDRIGATLRQALGEPANEFSWPLAARRDR